MCAVVTESGLTCLAADQDYPGSNPGHGFEQNLYLHVYQYFCMEQVDTVQESGVELVVVTTDDTVYRLPQQDSDYSELPVYIVDDVPEFVVTYLNDETEFELGYRDDTGVVPYIDYPIESTAELRTDNAIESHLYHNELLPTDKIDHADLSAINLEFEIREDGTTVVTNVSIWPSRNDIQFTDDAFDELSGR